jgi:hypothetical protein
MWIRTGNLVRHKAGDGPIMFVEKVTPFVATCSCVWVEDGVRKAAQFPASTLQTVYADGTPRDYDDET